MDENTIPLSDVYIAFCSSKPALYKAIVGLIFTSKMTPTLLSKLTLNDLLMACDEYFNEGEIKSLRSLLDKDPWTIIPTWNLDSENIITFNTPETTFYLFLYLKEKRMSDLNDLRNPLFKTGKNKFLTSSKISSYVTEFNSILSLFNKNHKKQFRSKNLIHTFEYIYNKHMNIEISNKKNLLSLFEGKLAKNSKFYMMSNKNLSKIKKYYESLIPFLTARTYNLDNLWEFPTQDTNKEMIIEDYYNSEFKEELGLSYGQEQLLLDFASKLTRYKFYNDADYLNKIIKKAIVLLNLNNYDFDEDIFSFYGYYMEKNPSPEAYAAKFENTIENLKINNLIKVKEYELYKQIIKYIIKNNYYNKDIKSFEAEKIIKEILFDLIDK